jgi:hypothetical protein
LSSWLRVWHHARLTILFCQSSLTYDVLEGKKPEVAPDTSTLTAKDLKIAFPASAEARDFSVSPARKAKYGWAFCLKATRGDGDTRRRIVLWMNILAPGVFDRRPAEAADQCELVQYTQIPNTSADLRVGKPN